MQKQFCHNSSVGYLLLFVISTVFLGIIPMSLYALQPRPKIGLVLSGGGAKGVAHIGVLKVLEEAGIPIDYISGTSMGAIIGGLYAIGYNAHELDSMVRTQDWVYLLTGQVQRTFRSYQNQTQRDRYLFSVPFSNPVDSEIRLPSGIMRGQSILNKFSDLTVGYHQIQSFDSLPIPFSCVAGDLEQGCEVVIRSGSLPLAMRASMAIPEVFEPVYQDSMVLVDGGIFNNFPVDVVRKMGADFIIGVDLSTVEFEKPDYHSIVAIADRIAFLTGEEKKEINKNQTDLYLNPKLVGYTSADFQATDIDTMILRGEQVARNHWDELMALRCSLNSGFWDEEMRSAFVRPMAYTDSLYIGDIVFHGLQSYEKSWIMRLTGMREHAFLTIPMLENYVKTLQGTGLFRKITYRITGEGNDRELDFLIEEKPEGIFNIGMHLDTEDIASILFHTRFKTKGKNGSSFFSTTRINQSPWFNIGYTLNTANMKSVEFLYRIGYDNFCLLKDGEKIGNPTFLYNHAEMNFRTYYIRNFSYRLGIQFDYFSHVSDMYTPDYEIYDRVSEGHWSAFLNLSYDTFDHLEHPTKGVLFHLKTSVYEDDFWNNNNCLFGDFQFKVRTALPVTSRFYVLPEVSGRLLAGKRIPSFYLNYVGTGFSGRYFPQQQVFYGVHGTEIVKNSWCVFRLDLRYKMASKHYLSCIANYAANASELGNLWHDHGMWGMALLYSYDSLIGPLSVVIDYSGRMQQFGFYANIGYYF